MHLFPPELEIAADDGFAPGKDIFDRAPFGENLTRMVQSIEDPLVLLLDGAWGTGKTTFIKMWLSELSKLGIPNIYFDAFANDYHEDAFLTIAGEIISRAEAQRPRRTKSIKAFKTTAIQVAKALGRASLKIGIRTASAGLLTGDEIADGIKITADAAKVAGDEAAKAIDELVKERLESHKADREAFEQFKEALAELPSALSSKDNKVPAVPGNGGDKPAPILVFVIDELDRCRPPFALDLLEKIKHLFSVPGITFVLISSLKQLESAARFAYGDIDARTYLEKFYHLRILFPSDITERPDQATTVRYLKIFVLRAEWKQLY